MRFAAEARMSIDNKVLENKQFIWEMLKSGKWTKEHLLSLKFKANDQSWNVALSAAQKWASSNVIQKSMKNNKEKIKKKRRQDPETERDTYGKHTTDQKVTEYEKKEKKFLVSQIKAHKNFKKNMASRLPNLELYELENLYRMLNASTESVEPGGTRYNNMQHRLESAKDSTKWHSRAGKSRRKR